MADQTSYGWWQVMDTAGGSIPKKAQVEIVLGDTELSLRRSDRGETVSAPYPAAFARESGPRKVVIYLGKDRYWLEATGPSSSEGLAAALDSRRQGTLGDNEPPEKEAVVVFSYPGRTQADAAALFSKHARDLARDGYVPVSQSWAEGRPGVGRVLMIGEAAGMLKPNGFLTVTYSLQERITMPLGASAPATAPDPIDQIRRLAELRDAGLVSPEEFEAKRIELLARL